MSLATPTSALRASRLKKWRRYLRRTPTISGSMLARARARVRQKTRRLARFDKTSFVAEGHALQGGVPACVLPTPYSTLLTMIRSSRLLAALFAVSLVPSSFIHAADNPYVGRW